MDKRLQTKKTLKEVFWFLVKFNLLLIPFYAVIYFDINFYRLQAIFASFIAWVLRLLGYSPQVSDIFIHVGNLPIDISRDCIGWKSIYSLFALVLASPGKLKDKSKFLGIWLPAMMVLNIFRVLIIILIGLRFGAKTLEIVHKFVWQEIMIIAIVVIWLLWLKKVKKINKEK
jgi:exosortase/archaeosortase family protein